MDWATFFKDYQVIINLVSGFVLAILGYIFGRWHAERNRNWELQDRAFNRGIRFRDSKIEEVQAFINVYIEIVQIFVEYETELYRNNELSEKKDIIKRVPELLNSTKKWRWSINALDDPELDYASQELVNCVYREWLNVTDLATAIDANEAVNYTKAGLRAKDFNHSANELIAEMQTRIDKLSQTVP